MHGTPAAAQRAKDRVFDALCWDLGLRLVRVHFKDVSRALVLLARAMRILLLPLRRSLLECTPQAWRSSLPL